MLRNVAYLEIDSQGIGNTGDPAVFELRHDLEIESQVEKQYLVGNFGTSIQEAVRFVKSKLDSIPEPSNESRRVGYSVDAGGGTWGGSLTFTTGLEDVRWGDGDGGDGPGNVTKVDASGEGVDALTRLQVLQYWLANSLSDSRGRVRLHIGGWTDGSYDDYRDGQKVNVGAGVFGGSIPIAVLNCEPRAPVDDPSAAQVTFNYRRTQITDALLEDVTDAFDSISNEFLSGDAAADTSDA